MRYARTPALAASPQGQWYHKKGRPEPMLRLFNISYRSGKLEHRSRHVTEPEWALQGYLEEAERIISAAMDEYQKQRPGAEDPALSPDFQHLRWFPLPSEVLAELTGRAAGAPERILHLRGV